MHDKRVVIYGGGMAGAMLAKRLSRDLAVTLVDPCDFFEVPMAAPRSLVDPTFARRAIIPFAQALPKADIVRGRLVELSPAGGIVEHAGGERSTVSGAVQVLATGSRQATALLRAPGGTSGERQDFYQRFHQRLKESPRVLIVGGGPVGIEVAGELSVAFPAMKLTLVETAERILRGTTAALAVRAGEVLAARGVTIITGQWLKHVGSPSDDIFAPGGEAVTSTGRCIPYDLVIWCTGARPNTAYLQPHFDRVLDDQGRVRVGPDLRVQGCDTLFALGDITDLDENKMAWHVAGQVDCAAINVRRVLQSGGRAGTLRRYLAQTGNPAMLVTLGPRQGVAQLPLIGMVRSDCFIRKLKAAHMLVPKYRKVLEV